MTRTASTRARALLAIIAAMAMLPLAMASCSDDAKTSTTTSAVDAGVDASGPVVDVDPGASDSVSADAMLAADTGAGHQPDTFGRATDAAGGLPSDAEVDDVLPVDDAVMAGDTVSVGDGGSASVDDAMAALDAVDSTNGSAADSDADDATDNDVGAADVAKPPPPLPYPDVDQKSCDAGDKAWVMRAMITLLGRRPKGLRELSLWTDIVKGVGRKQAARLMMYDAGYYSRWTEWIADQLRANRYGFRMQPMCWGMDTGNGESAALAKFIRDTTPLTHYSNPGATMRDVAGSALRLDDLSPAWIANLFAAMVRAEMYCQHTTKHEMERVRRRDFAERFAMVYTHRNPECAACHNSAFSVTDSQDPTKDHHWPLPGHFEKAIYGSHAMEPATPWQAMWRRLDIVTNNASPPPGKSEPAPVLPNNADIRTPWGLNGECGKLLAQSQMTTDPLKQTAVFFGNHGMKGSIWLVEQALRKGFDALRKAPLSVDPKTSAVDPHEALAYATSMRIAHQVWKEVMGFNLTLSHGHPRNKAQRDKLKSLTDLLVAKHWSLRAVLAEIVVDPLFNRAPPAAGCGSDDYPWPAVLNPWTTSIGKGAKKGNGPGDGAHRLAARTLLQMTWAALEWTPVQSFKSMPQADFEADIGAFVDEARQGFGSVTFQSLLAWEGRMGACEPFVEFSNKVSGDGMLKDSCAGRCGFPPMPGYCACDSQCYQSGDCCQDLLTMCETKPPQSKANDFVSQLTNTAAATAGVTLEQLVAALKDRLLLQPGIEPKKEAPLLAKFFGAATIKSKVGGLKDWPQRTRALCGTLLTTPQYMMVGLAAPAHGAAPTLLVKGADYASLCKAWAQGAVKSAGWKLDCAGAVAKLSKSP